ncbi:hypothetical protein EXD82_01105 [Peptacetobacter hominis]|uniref:HTH-like domain-containing protein n=1 Tax=Peptacetobacter hominis TaxID=2743610 RepID=A0A544QYZ4_9FIRM|nr:hypothetical protein EXD82_01105 [Peptacetobacter hominis]
MSFFYFYKKFLFKILGYRRITLELKNRRYLVNHKKVKRLMSIIGYMQKHRK